MVCTWGNTLQNLNFFDKIIDSYGKPVKIVAIIILVEGIVYTCSGEVKNQISPQPKRRPVY